MRFTLPKALIKLAEPGISSSALFLLLLLSVVPRAPGWK